MTHPRVYAKLRAEIDKAVESGISGTGIVPEKKARQLPYLSAVVREALRVSSTQVFHIAPA